MGRLKKVYAYQIKENKKYKGRYIICKIHFYTAE